MFHFLIAFFCYIIYMYSVNFCIPYGCQNVNAIFSYKFIENLQEVKNTAERIRQCIKLRKFTVFIFLSYFTVSCFNCISYKIH